MRSRHFAALLAPAAVLALAAPALASGPVLPPDFPNPEQNSYLYTLFFSATPTEWSPQGTVVADSGFRPEANGFPYPNFGASYAPFNLFYDMPSGGVQPVSSATMRDLYGDGVCLTTKGTEPGGDCPLTPAAQYYAEYIFDATSGGHCYGFAATASAVYDGTYEPSAVGASTLMTQSQLTNATQQLITRNWASQFTASSNELKLTPAGVIETLILDLTPGSSPFVLSIRGEINGVFEGHAITPYAVYDRGNGVYDIAVYDNNYSGRQRAVHVDTVANTWDYLMQTKPDGEPVIMSGDATSFTLVLTPVSDIVAQQPCIICQGGEANNLVTLDPTPLSAGDLELGIIGSDGAPLPEDKYTTLPPLNPIADEESTYQAFSVEPGTGFGITVSGDAITESVPVVIRDHSGGSVKVASAANLPVGFGALAEFDAAGVLAFAADVPSKPKLEHVFAQGVRHYTTIVYGGDAVAADNGRTLTVKTASEAIYYGDVNSAGGTMTVNAALDRGADSKKFRATNVAYPAGGQLVLDYSDWKRTNQRPTFGVDTNGDGVIDVTVKMKRVGK